MSMPDCICADTYTCAVPVSRRLNTIADMCKQSRRLVCCSFVFKNWDLCLQSVRIAGGGFCCKLRKATATSSFTNVMVVD